MKKFKLMLLGARIEIHWFFIRRQRQQGRRLLEKGKSCASPELVALNRRYSKHCSLAVKAQQAYNSLFQANGPAISGKN